MKRISKNLLLLAVSLFVGFLMFFYVGDLIGWDSIWSSFSMFTTMNGFVVVLLSFLIVYISTIRWREILKDQGVKKINTWELFKIYLEGFSIVYLFPVIIMGSEAFRSYALKKNTNIGWEKSVSSIVIERILEWTVNVLVIFIGVLYFFYAIASPDMQTFCISLIFFIIISIIIIFVYTYIFKKKSFVRKIIKKFNKEEKESVAIKIEQEVFKFFNFKSKKLWKGYFISLARALVMALRVWIIIFFLGEVINFMPTISILGFSYLSTLIPIPATLGSQDLIQAFVFGNLGFGTSMSAAFTMILRAGDVIVSIVGLFLIARTGFSFLRNKILENEK